MGRHRFALSVFTIAMFSLSTVVSFTPVGVRLPPLGSREAAAAEGASAVPDRTFLGEVYDAVVLQEYVDLQFEALEATVRELEATGFGDQLDAIIDRVLATGRLVVLFFHAEWCYVCDMETPIIDAVEAGYADRVCILRVDGPRNPDALRAFGVAGYPTLHLVYGRNASAYQRVEFVGYTAQARLEAAIDYVLAEGTAPPRDEDDVRADVAALLAEWPHHTCDVDACLSDCHYSEDMHPELSRIAYELVRLTGECALCAGAIAECLSVCSWTVVACAGTLGAACGLVALCVGCFALVAAAEFMPGPSCLGCLDDFSQTGDAIGDLWETLEACDGCCDDPMTCEYGPQECKDPALTGLPDADRCVGNKLVSMTCQECEWAMHPGSTFTPCQEGSHCVETSITMAECRDKDDDEDAPSSGPGGDNPDDNQILAATEATTPDLSLTIPEVAVLRRGYYDGATALLATIGEVTTLLDFSFPLDLAAQYPVLVIPSGGLYGLGTSALFKAKLAAYVASGGTLIALSQQHGEDYQALPGSLEGYGWIEDQSCQSRSVAMSTYHPILSGVYPSEGMLDLRVDGFFTAWPDEALVLFTRVKNGQPAVVMYPYGSGQVIASTLFTDYNTVLSWLLQTNDERAFFRNLITWAKHPQPVPSYAQGTLVDVPLNLTSTIYDATVYPAHRVGDTVDVTVNVTHRGTEASNRISFRLLDPTYQVHVVNVTAQLAPNETQTIPIAFTASDSPPDGVWYVLYGLFADDRPVWADVAGAFTLTVDLDTLSTYTVVFTLLDPEGHVVEQRNVTAAVDAMATAQVHFTYTPTLVGLWSVDYVVYDYRERIVDFGVRLFAVSYYQVYPEGWAYQGTEVRFSVTTERERFVYGSPANFTFHLWNDGDTAQNVTVTWGVHHHTWYGIVPAGIYDAFATWIVVPAAGYASFNYTLPAVVDYMGDRLRAKLYVDGSWVGTVEKGIYAYGGSYVRANLEFDMTTDRAAYRSGDTVTITLNVTSTLDFAYTTRLNLLVGRVGRGDDLWSTPYDLHVLNASLAVSVFTVTLPQATLDGRYFVRVRSGRWAWAYAYFTVLPYEVDVAVDLPDVYHPHTPAAGILTLNNTGDQDLRNTTVTVAFLDPDQRAVWNATTTFPPLAVNQTAALPFAIPVTAVRLGVYQFAYHVTFDPQKTVAGTVDLPSSLRVDLAFDRAAYRAREDVGVTVDVVNDGVFAQNRSLRLDVPDIGYTATWELQVHPGHAERVDVVVPLPSNSTVGVHDVHLAVQDDGNWTASTYRFTIPESQLRVALGEARYDGGDDAQVVLRNLGGVDTEVEYAITLLGPTGPVAPPRNATATILAGSAVGTTYPLPRSLLTGPYDLRVATRNARTNTTGTTRLPLWLDGLRVDVTVTTDRDVYRPSDSVTVAGQLTNAGALLENGTLHLEIVAALPGMTAANWTTYVPLPIGLVDVIAFDPAGNAWLGGYGFVVRYQDGAWDHYTIQDGLPGTIITSLVVDAGGQVWVGADSSTAGLSVFDGAGWTRLNATNTGLTFPFTTALAIGPDGDVWVGSRSGDGVHRFNGTHWTTYNTTNSGMVSNRVGCIAVDDDGTAWFGGGRWDEYGVTRYNGTHWTTYDASHTGINRDRVDAITFDRDGRVWIAHDHYLGGISVYNGTHWTTYRRAPTELPDYAVRALAVDADGHVWAATGGGVAVFNGTTWTHHTAGASGVESNDLEAIVVDAAGQVWVGYNDFPGVSRYDGAQWARLVPTIIDDTVYDVTVDADGVVWFATHWGISRYDGDAWTYLTATTSGLLSDTVYVLEFDHAGNVWAGTPQGISAYNGTGWTSYDEPTTGVDLSSMQAFAADPYGNLWFASKLKTGAVRYNGTHWTTFNTTTSGLASDDVRALLVDAYGDLWIATDRGVNWYNRTHWRLYNASHSALGSDDVIDLALDAQNRVWIVHGTGVSAFDRTTWTTFDPQLFEDLEVALGYFSTIALDPHDRVWVGASRTFTMGGRGYGALTYDGHDWTKYNVTNSGLASNFVNAIGFAGDDVWFGTNGHGASRLATTVAEPSPVLWQANVTLTLTDSAVNTTTIAVGPLGVTGKLHLRGHLQSAEGRGIASDVHPFYIVDGDLLLTFDLDDAVYKLGESVTLTGAVRNLDPAQAYDGLTVTLRDGATLVYQASVDLPANGTYPFATSFVAASAGEQTLEATVVQNSATLVTVRDQYTAAAPSVVVEVTAPAIVGWDPFPIAVRVNNTGATDATVTVNGTTVTLIPGAVRFLELTHQVDRTTTYALVVTGDYDATLLADVVLGASATLTLTPASVYPEGFVAIPYAIVNTGSLDVNATVTFTLNASTAMREVFVPAMQTLTGRLLYNLSDGAYTLGYSSVFGSGHVAVTVVTPDQIDVTLHDRERVNGTLRVPVTVTNVGANAVAGTIRLRSDVYTGEEPFTLPVDESRSVVWNVSLLDVQAGTYPVAVQVLVDGAMLQAIDFTIHATRPRFVVDVPVNASFPWGALANLTLTVRNAGDAAGDAAVTLTMPGIHEEVQSTGIPGGSTTLFTFAVPIPDDLAAGWYPAVYALNGVRYETTVYVEGANVSVTASSNQSLYAEGANATVTLRIANRNGLILSLVATVHSDASAALAPFNLSSGGEAVLTFDVPVGFEGQPSQTILYTVSLASGRALYIGDLYLYARPPASSGIMLSTDRQVYAIGDTVTVTVTASRTGAFTASALNFYVEEDLDEGPRVYTFTVPELLSGTYAIDYTFDGYAGSYPFDVNGYSARIVELTLDKTAYAVGEAVRLEMEVEARRAFAALLRVTVYDQFSVPIDRYPVNVTLVAGANRIAVTRPIPRGGLGLYAINPRIYVDLPAHSYVLVTSGARFFDVTADAVPPLVTITSPTDATDLAGTIWLNVTVNEAVAWMRYSLDGDANVTLTTNHALLELTPGSHAVTVYATDPSGNLGASTAAFTVVPVDDAPPDPVVLAAPSGITHAAMTLTWTATTAVDFANYTVYQTTVQSTLGTAIATITDASTTTYAVIGLSPETTYYHTVRVTDTGGQYADSNTVSATTTAAPPPPPTEFPWVYLIVLVAVIGVVAVVLVRKSIV